jgi:hypothetical protein
LTDTCLRLPFIQKFEFTFNQIFSQPISGEDNF